MWRTLCCLIGVLSTAFLNSINALTNNRVTNRARPHCQISMLKDDGFKPKIITPNDIASLFGDNGRTVNNVVLDGYSEDDDDFDFDGDEVDLPAKEEVKAIPVAVTKMITDRSDAETNSMRELLALQKEMMAPPSPEEVVIEAEVTVMESSYASDEPTEDVDDYLNFDKVLDKVNQQQSSPTKRGYTTSRNFTSLICHQFVVVVQVTRKRVRDTMTMTESRFGSVKSIPRVFKYDPTDVSHL